MLGDGNHKCDCIRSTTRIPNVLLLGRKYQVDHPYSQCPAVGEEIICYEVVLYFNCFFTLCVALLYSVHCLTIYIVVT